ncbi:DUF3667 domain-containing protein [Qipengyuania sp. DSG2-2]|uniref:DUF3667 domain-containing protein n=1 Tax=Qipengyuania sp. DGS2-2 TaxID=3349631 RepID=UPI0036D2A2E1
MSGDNLDALGQIAEGALLGAAVEPAHGGKGDNGPGDGPEGGSACPNCGAAVSGIFCSHCGQKAQLHRTLSAFWHDLIHGALHFDGKLWRTLPLLAWKPGELTRRYIEGQRARFVSPMAIFLFSVFLMFAVFQVAGISAPTDIGVPGTAGQQFEKMSEQVDAEIAGLEEEISELPESDPSRDELLADLTEAREAKRGLERGTDILTEESGSMTMNVTGIESIDQGIVQKWRDNPGLMLYKLQNNFYKFSFLLIPLSIPSVWLLFFWKRRFKAYDHAIFVTYSLAFMSLLFLVLSVLGVAGVPTEPLVLAGMIIPVIHIYRQLRGAYELSRRSAIWRTIALLFSILFGVSIPFLWILLMLGAF